MKKHTKVKAYINGDYIKINWVDPTGPNSASICKMLYYKDTDIRANIIVEALNVKEETGLSPLELKEQNEKMRKALLMNMSTIINHGSIDAIKAYDKAIGTFNPLKGTKLKGCTQ